MASRCPNHRLAKIHRNYTVEEAATLLGVHKNTVRAWIKQGLPTTDGKRPALILGRELRAFLAERRLKRKRPCKPGEMYCMRCRVPRSPAGGVVQYKPVSSTLGRLCGACPECGAVAYRAVNPAKLPQVLGELKVIPARAPLRIDESSGPPVNGDFSKGAGDHEKTQS